MFIEEEGKKRHRNPEIETERLKNQTFVAKEKDLERKSNQIKLQQMFIEEERKKRQIETERLNSKTFVAKGKTKIKEIIVQQMFVKEEKKKQKEQSI